MSKEKLPTTPSRVYTEFKKVMQTMASTASELKPYDFEALREKVMVYHHETGVFNRAFYSVIDMQTGDFSWLHGICESLGLPEKPLQLVDFLALLHPHYLPMFRFWAMAINQAAYSLAPGDRIHDYVYHIGLPLRRNDHTYHWYTQHSFALQSDEAGHYVTHFNFYDYNGPWHAQHRPPFIPFITAQHQPAQDLEQMMYAFAAPLIRTHFTHTEQMLIEWYILGEPEENKLRMQPHTLHEHNRNILKKVGELLLVDCKSARNAAHLLLETKLWQVSG